MTIMLNGSDLTVTEVVAAARHGEAVALAPGAIETMEQARAVVEEVLAKDEPVYGLTTGVGERKSFLLDPAERRKFNQRLVLNHRIAQGDVAPADVVRGAMVCLANSYAKGVTGVRPELAEMIVTLLNEGFAPPVRRLGSVGQGDLGPMADLAHGLITRSGFEVAENEGLALVSSNAFTTAWACLALADAQTLMDTFDVAGALDLEAFGANLTCLHPVIEQTRPFPGLAATLGRLRELLDGSYLWHPNAARFLQDPLTFRCLPQIHGAARDALGYAGNILQLELNSSQSNPVVVKAERRIVSVGNFDIGPLAAALDFARIALAPVVTSANERMVKLLQAPFSGLAAGLAAATGHARRRAVRAGHLRPGHHRGGPHAGPPGLLRAGQLGQGRGHRGPGHDGAAVGPPPGRHGRPVRPGRGHRAGRRRPGHRPQTARGTGSRHRPRLPDGPRAGPVHPGRRHAARRPGAAGRAGLPR